MNTGFIKLFRKFTEWEWYSDANTMRLFIHLLLKCNHKPSRFRGHDVPSGSVVTGRNALAAELNLSDQQIRTALDKLKKTGEITSKTTNAFSIISITYWSKYQVNQPTDNQRITNEQPTDNQRITTSKECKNETMEECKNKNALSRFDEFWTEYPKKIGKRDCKKKWKARKLDSMADMIIADVKDRGIRCDKWKAGYAPNPLTYINGDRWEDDVVKHDGQQQKPKDAPWEELLSKIGKYGRDEYPKFDDKLISPALFKAGSWMELLSMNPKQQLFEFKPKFMEAYNALSKS